MIDFLSYQLTGTITVLELVLLIVVIVGIIGPVRFHREINRDMDRVAHSYRHGIISEYECHLATYGLQAFRYVSYSAIVTISLFVFVGFLGVVRPPASEHSRYTPLGIGLFGAVMLAIVAKNLFIYRASRKRLQLRTLRPFDDVEGVTSHA